MVVRREFKLTVMLSENERRSLALLADADGLNASDWLRQELRKRYAQNQAAYARSASDLPARRKPRARR